MTDDKETEDVRQGRTTPWARRVLIISTTIAAAALFAALLSQ